MICCSLMSICYWISCLMISCAVSWLSDVQRGAAVRLDLSLKKNLWFVFIPTFNTRFSSGPKKNRRNLLLENFTVKFSLSFQVMSSSHSQCAQQEEDHLANVMKGLGDGFLKLLEVSAGWLVTKICSHVTKLDGKSKKTLDTYVVQFMRICTSV